jgi:hypothetical protein
MRHTHKRKPDLLDSLQEMGEKGKEQNPTPAGLYNCTGFLRRLDQTLMYHWYVEFTCIP